MAHDLKAPLRAVSGFGEVLLSKYQENLAPEGKRLLERMCANSQRMSEMLEGLLQLSRLFHEPLQPGRIDLRAMVSSLFEQLGYREPERSVQVVVAEGLSVFADARLVKTLYQHLLGNAWKFTAPKAVARIEVRKKQGAFFVRDNGVGYEMRYAEKLFAPFQRLHGSEFEGLEIGRAHV